MVPYSLVLSETWSGHWKLNQFPHQNFLVRRVARNPTGLGPRHVKEQVNIFVGSMAFEDNQVDWTP